MKPRRVPSRPAPMPDVVAANATWDAWCAALRACMVAKTAAQHAIAQAECDRIREWYAANGVDPEGIWGVDRWVLSGDRVMPRAVWRYEDARIAKEARRIRRGS